VKKAKILLALSLALVTVLTLRLMPGANASPSHNAIFVPGQMNYITDGQIKAMDAVPFIENGRTLVPVRYLALALGVPEDQVVWSASANTVTISLGETSVVAALGDRILHINDRPVSMEISPVMRNNRVYMPARYIAEAFGYEVGWDQASQSVLIGPPGNLPGLVPGEATLPTVGTYDNLKDLLEKANLARSGQVYYLEDSVSAMPLRNAAPESMKQAAETGVPLGTGASGPADYSKTNVQVEGVDEADIVKTDGTYIYQVNRERIVIAKAFPASDLAVVSTLNYAEKNFSPQEIYVDENHLVVIGSSNTYAYDLDYRGDTAPEMMPPYYQELVKAIVYNIEDKTNIKQEREVELTGSYVSSRKIGQSLYLLANKHIYFYPKGEIMDPKPMYRDTAVNDEFISIDYPEIKCFPGFVEPNYLITAGFNLGRPDEKASVSSYLGAGQNIYASTNNLYVALTSYSYAIPLVEIDTGLLKRIFPSYDTSNTKLYKFALSDGRITNTASGEVPGTLLNQFSMDEHNNNFRVATTRGDSWRSGDYTSKNNVYILNSSLMIVGKIEDIAPGERIYSVRFVGDRGYMVTFKNVDPFFVLDLKDPAHPSILGALKIPGYSDYLHPYDENHVIGFGKDTIEIGSKGMGGESMAFYQGMKMALFDVSDVKNPVEKFRENIGDRGTDSELLRNHKALLFSKDKNLLAFPVTVMSVQGDNTKPGTSFPEYGSFAYQGAYVYNFDLTSGFVLKGKITHLSGDDYLKAGNYWYNSEKNIERILYIDDVLYTLSKKFIKANDLNNLTELKGIEIK